MAYSKRTVNFYTIKRKEGIRVLTQMQQTVLELTAASLFGGQVNIPEDTDWNAVLEESNQQSVLLQVFSAAQSFLPADIIKQWKPLCDRIIANNVRIEWEHTELHEVMTKANMPYVVIKGCASSAHYPDSALRIMGDVDFLVAPENIDEAGELLEGIGFKLEERDEEEIHVIYRRAASGGWSVWEMHWQVNGVPDGPAGERVKEYLSAAIADAVESRTPSGVFMAPSVFHHGLVILLHTATHLIDTGVGLRHLCDWAVFVQGISDDEFCALFEEKLKAVGLWRFAQLLTQLASRYLGLREVSWASGDDRLVEQMIADIFDGGNFGRKDEQRINQALLMIDKDKHNVSDDSMIKQFLLSLKDIVFKRAPYVKKYPVLFPVGLVYIAIRYVARVITGKRKGIDLSSTLSGASKRREIYREFHLFET